jgi:hypothetical protein
MGIFDALRRMFSASAVYRRLFKKVKTKRSFQSIVTMLSKPIQRTKRSSILYDELNTEFDILHSNVETDAFQLRLYELGTKALVTGAQALNNLVDQKLRRWDKMHWLDPYLNGVLDTKIQKLAVSVLYEIFDEFVLPHVAECSFLHSHAKRLGSTILARLKTDTHVSSASKKSIRKGVEFYFKCAS